MGSCVCTPAKAEGVVHRRQREIIKPVPQCVVHDSPRKSAAQRAISVLERTSGDNIFERYRFGKELGRGEFGITHQCIDRETGETFACKMISKSKLKTDIDIQDVRREAEIMRRLPNHPNIVSFKEAYEDKEAVYLVMELCEGGELFNRIVAKGHYTERAAANVTKTILEVCKVCHKHGVIHRDLKPENFLFADSSENAQLKAIDFGLSIFFEPGQRFNEIVGSPYYMAPEVLRRNYGPEVDVWSAGVILYILLCGVPPFWSETEEGIAHAIIRGNIDFERDTWPKVCEEAKDLVRSMLDPTPYNRLTVEEVLDHPWIRNANQVSNVPLGENVRLKIKQFTLMNKFKKKVLRVVADNLPDEQIDGIRQIFDMMDIDKTGDLTFEELRDGLQKIGHHVTDPDVQLLLDAGADVDFKISWKRVAITSTFGFAFVGPVGHFWYEGLDKFIRLKLQLQPKSLRFVATKVAMDGIIFGPLDLFVFFTYMGFSAGKSVAQVKEDLKRDFVPALILEGGVWPIVQVANFRYVPVRYQLLYVNVFCLLDSAFLSWVEQQKDAAWKQWFTSFNSFKERGGQGRL